MRPIITLTSDFGTQDSYVGIMKGVILNICPDAHMVDITHEIAPQDILGASFLLQTTIAYFPAGTVHLVVVDPGVGSTRKPIALATPHAYFVGPDNGLFGFLCEKYAIQAIELQNPRFWLPKVSKTFHGRDMFAPVAAHLAQGIPLQEFGPSLDTIVTLSMPKPVWEDRHTLKGEIISIDRFGNCISNITTAHLEPFDPNQPCVVMKEPATHPSPSFPSPIPICQTYAEVPEGTPIALIGSSLHLEIAIRNGNAHRKMHLAIGTPIRVEQTPLP